MLMRHTALILFSGLFIAASAVAQDGTGSGETEAPPPAAVGATGAGAGTTDVTAGSFGELSPGNQKIAEAIQAAQTHPESGYTVDRIAEYKQDGMGWGEIFKQMQADGLTTHKNLGQAVSSYQHDLHGISPGSEVVITTGSGQQITVGGKKKSSTATTSSANGKTKSKGHKSGAGKGVHVTTAGGGHGPVSTGKGAGKTHITTGNGSSSSGIVTGAGAGASSSGVIHGGGGNAYGHAKAGKTGK